MRLKEKLILKIKCKSVKFAFLQMMIEASKCESLSDSDSFFACGEISALHSQNCVMKLWKF